MKTIQVTSQLKHNHHKPHNKFPSMSLQSLSLFMFIPEQKEYSAFTISFFSNKREGNLIYNKGKEGRALRACATSHEGLRQVEGANSKRGSHNSRVWRHLSKRLATTQVWCHLSTLSGSLTPQRSPSWESAPKGRRQTLPSWNPHSTLMMKVTSVSSILR